MQTSLDEVLALARSQIGTVESPPNSNNVEYTRWHGHVGWPWCSIFCCWLLWTTTHRNGEKSPLEGIDYPYGPAYSGSVMVAGQQRRNGLGWSDVPVVGAFAIYDWDWKGMTDHIGVVSWVSATDRNLFRAIEGNTSSDNGGSQSDGGGVFERFRRNDRGYVRGFVTVPYGRGGKIVPVPNSKIIHPGQTPPPYPGRDFAITSPFLHGNDVKQWQDHMRWRGWDMAADGWFGPVSQEIAKQFQLDKHLQADGVVGRITWNATWKEPVTA